MSAIRRLAVAGAFAALLVGLTAAPALAHVSVVSTDAVQGGEGVVTFRVPTESDSAATTKLAVQLPTDSPIAAVAVRPVPGWTHKETTTKLANPVKTDEGDEVTEVVSTIEWAANTPADGIKPGEYGEFSISAGPLPKAQTITFKAIQTYSDGKQVAWIEEAVNGAEPEHPAPVLTLAPAAAEGGAAPSASAPTGSAPGTGSGSGSGTAGSGAATDTGSGGTAKVALVLGILGLLAGMVGLGVALAGRRGGSGPAPAEPAAAGRAPAEGTSAGTTSADTTSAGTTSAGSVAE
jgi:uncharacterized protein YcnI